MLSSLKIYFSASNKPSANKVTRGEWAIKERVAYWKALDYFPYSRQPAIRTIAYSKIGQRKS